MTRTLVAASAALLLLGAQAYAAEGYRDPSDLRTPGVNTRVQGVDLPLRDTDPFGLRVPGKKLSMSVPEQDGEASANVAGMLPGQDAASHSAEMR
jgi:hypothetical protein